jgi:threonine/homoserine/homoserine lactone efflux protein
VFEILAAGFVIGLTHAIPPGPITFEVLKRGISEGLLSALKADLGAVAADGVFFILIALGLSQILEHPPGRLAMWVGSCALLTFLGIRGIYKVAAGRSNTDAEKATSSSPLAAGFLICITSPFAIVWWTGIFAGAMAVQLGSDAISLAGMFAGIALACLAWYACLGALGAVSKKKFKKSWLSALSLACSLMMLGFAVILFYRGYATFL